MGAIEEIFAELDAEISEESFREAVAEKVEEMGGLADEETAAMLIAHELDDGAVRAVADIAPGQDEVRVTAKVTRVGELRTFERDDGDEGQVINVEVADETGSIRVAFWDDRAVAADRELEPGQVLKLAGRPTEGYNGVEVNVDRVEVDPDAEVDLPETDGTIADLTQEQSGVTLRGRVLDAESPRTFDRDDGSEGRVANLTLGDETGRVRVTLWDAQADRASELAPGTSVEVVDGYVRERDGELELHIGSRGTVAEIDEDVAYAPDATPIADLELGETVDIAGVIRSADQMRTFERDDGSEGQVRNVRVQDETGDVRVALWGEKAERDLEPGHEVLVADGEVQEGWQDDLEISAGWRASVSVLDATGTGTAGGTTGSAPPAHRSGADDSHTLSTFADGSAEPQAASTGDPVDPAPTVEFTGVVVQAGDPVLLDDGEETITVRTSDDLHLGEEVTVRGPLVEGTLDAEEVIPIGS